MFRSLGRDLDLIFNSSEEQNFLSPVKPRYRTYHRIHLSQLVSSEYWDWNPQDRTTEEKGEERKEGKRNGMRLAHGNHNNFLFTQGCTPSSWTGESCP